MKTELDPHDDAHMAGAPVSPGNTLAEIHVLHVYQGKGLVGFYWHPNPLAIEGKEREARADLDFGGYTFERVRYVRAER